MVLWSSGLRRVALFGRAQRAREAPVVLWTLNPTTRVRILAIVEVPPLRERDCKPQFYGRTFQILPFALSIYLFCVLRPLRPVDCLAAGLVLAAPFCV